MNHRNRIAILCVTLVAAVMLGACAVDKTDIVDAYRTAYNAGDVDGVMSLLSDDAIFRVSGVFNFQGQEAIRNVAGFDSALHTTMTMREISTAGDTVSCTLIETNDWLELTGIDSAVYSAQFVVVDGSISAILAESSPSTAEAMSAAMMPVIGWTIVNQSDELDKLIVDGQMVYDADNAHRMMRLTRAARAR